MPMASDITTIRVHKETLERLAAVRIPGLTNEDVINFALDNIPPEKLRSLYSEWQREAMEKLMGNARVMEANPHAAGPNAAPWRGKPSSSPSSRKTSARSKKGASRAKATSNKPSARSSKA